MKQSIGSGRGSVYNIILKALQTGDKYGYEICQEIETKTNGHYILKQPSLYSGLKRLESQKLVTSYWGDSDIGGRRHYYSLTKEGRQKIESSNFSWEDERSDLLDNFFKQSETDKNIKEIENSLQELNEQVQTVQQQNEEVKTILTTTEQKTTKNSLAHKVNENQYDLFSYANLSNVEENQKEDIIDETLKEEIKQQEILKEEQIEQPNDTLDINESKINFNEIFNSRKNNSFSNHLEEKPSTPFSYNNFDNFPSKNNETQSNLENYVDDFDAKFEQFNKMMELSAKEEELKQKEDQLRQEQEKLMSDALSGNLHNHNYDFIEQEPEQIKVKEKISNDAKEDELENINLKSIFKDVIKEEDFVEEKVTEKSQVTENVVNINAEHLADFTQFNDTNFGGKEINLNQEVQSEQVTQKYDYSDNVNLSLRSDYKPKQNTYNENSYYNYQEPVHDNQTPFDEKYSQPTPSVNNYKIRYLRKNNIEETPTNFTSINKLNLTVSGLIGTILLLLTLCLFLINREKLIISPIQNSFIIINVVVFVAFIFYFLINYLKDKDYKIEYEFNSKKFKFGLFLGILIVIVIIVVNILCGINFSNILDYSGTMIIPLIDTILLSLFPIIKYLFNKIPYYAK